MYDRWNYLFDNHRIKIVRIVVRCRWAIYLNSDRDVFLEPKITIKSDNRLKNWAYKYSLEN